MTSRRVVLFLVGLFVVGAAGELLGDHPPSPSALRALVWHTYLYAVPTLLAGVVALRYRWAFMVAVMYGTIGCALDLSTITQELGQAGFSSTVLTLSLLDAALSVGLIITAGACFLDVKG